MMRQYAAQSGERLDLDVVGPRYEDVTKIADSMYEVCEENADYFQAVLVQWQSFEESSKKFNTWMDNMVQKSFAAAREMPEDDIDAVLMKLMKYRELDRKFTERQPSKDGLVYEAEQVLTATGENAPSFLSILSGKNRKRSTPKIFRFFPERSFARQTMNMPCDVA